MYLIAPRFHGHGILLAVLASTLCTGLLHGSGLSLSTTTATTITCNTATTGPATPVIITVKPGTDVTYPVVVTPGPLPAGLVVTPSTGTFASASAANVTSGIAFTLSAAQGCAGLSGGANSAATFHFMVSQNSGAPVADTNNVTTTITVTAAASGLSASASASTISCLLNGSTYTPSPSTITLTVTNAETGGTPFTIARPTWMTLTTQPPYTVTSAIGSSSIVFTPSCSGPVGTINTGSITLTDSPAPPVTVPLTMKVVAPSTLTATTPAPQTYVKASGSAHYPSWTVTLGGATDGQIYTVNPATLGSWLTASPMSGAYGTANTIIFQATGGIDSLAASSTPYTQTVHISISGYADTTVTISLLVANPASTLSFAEGTVRNLTWVQGQGIPTATITAVSSNEPIQYSTTSSGAIAPIIAASEQSGLAYSFGTEIPVTFPNLPFSEAQPGNVLTGVVTFIWGSNTSTVTFYVTVQAGTSTAVLNSATPVNLPTASTGEQFTVTLYGSGFVPASDPTQRTTVGVVNASNLLVQDPNIIGINVMNSSTIALTIQAPTPSTDPLLPWTGTSVVFGVCNPAGGTCSTPTGSLAMVVGAGPTISSVVSASTQTSASTPNVAPYDILTLWGSNFCTANGTGCGATGVLYGNLNPSTMTYTTALSPDGGQRNLTVSFKAHTASASSYVAAPLLFANNGQINVVVPASGFPASGAVDVMVSFGGLSSNVFEVTATATDPGIFMLDTYGQGAILNPNYTVANGSNPAVAGNAISIYATGLGAPTSMSGVTPVTYSSMTCITPANYETIAGNGSSIDGALIQAALLGGDLPPCFGTGNAPSAITVGGQAATIGYTGFVDDSVAGLYQANVTLHAATGPSSPAYFVDAAGTHLASIISPVQLPVSITSNSLSSQAPGANLGLNPGVTVWVAPPGLTLSSLGAQSVTSMGGAWTPSITASGGTGPYTFEVDGMNSPATGGLAYSVTSPTLTFATAPTAVGVYVITVTAIDANGSSGSTTFTLTVSDSSDTSTVTASATPITPSVYGTANPAVTTITPGGGAGAPYAFSITPSAVLSVSPAGVVSILGTAQAGMYHAVVTVTDSSGNATRNIYFDVPVAMALTATNNVTTLTGIANLTSAQQLTTIGNQGGGSVSYILIQPDSAKCTMTVPGGVLTVPASGCPAGTYSVTAVGEDMGPTNGASGAVAILNLSVHLN